MQGAEFYQVSSHNNLIKIIIIYQLRAMQKLQVVQSILERNAQYFHYS